MNHVMAHFEHENAEIKVSDLKSDIVVDYRVLSFGYCTTLFLSEEQAEKLFDELDKKLHEKTYLDLQDEIFNLECDLNNANEELEMYQDNK